MREEYIGIPFRSSNETCEQLLCTDGKQCCNAYDLVSALSHRGVVANYTAELVHLRRDSVK